MSSLWIGLWLMGCSGQPQAQAPQDADAQAIGGPADPDWGKAKWTQNKKYEVSLHTEPAPVAMGELFTMVALVKDREGKVIEDATVSLDARMPQHGHGMATNPVNSPGDCQASAKDEDGGSQPTDSPKDDLRTDAAKAKASKDQRCTHPGGLYQTSGFKFHMTGQWTVLVDIVGPLGRENTSFVYDLR